MHYHHLTICLSLHIPGLPQHHQIIEYSEPTSPSQGVSGNALHALSSGGSGLPRILTEGQVFRVELGQTLLLPCQTQNLGPMILLWKKGTRVLTADSIKVRRDKRLELQGTGLQIRDIDRDDSGEYVCEIETDEDEPVAIVHSVEILGE